MDNSRDTIADMPNVPRYNPEDTVFLKQLSGHPPKLNREQQLEAAKAFNEYIDERDDPDIPSFLSYDPVALKLWLTDGNLRHYPIFSRLLNKAHKKTEAYLLHKGLDGRSTAMSIFRLKQPTFGYRDRFDQDITSNGEKITFVNQVPRADKSNKKNTLPTN